MNELALIDDHTFRQVRASDPRASAWVSANAGSGKTHVLAQRVKRLLLDGVDPGKILCLTFTKAAAANMANRVLGDLAKWVAMSDAELDRELAKLKGETDPRLISRTERAAARRVFARALETPGGLKIQTIHAFCDALLHQFPFEAGVAASFEVMDDARAAELIVEARIAVIREASLTPDSPLGRALARVTGAIAEDSFAELLGAIIGMRADVDAILPDLTGLAALNTRIRGALGLAAGATREGLEARILSEAALPPERWAEAIDLLRSTGRGTDAERARDLATALSATDEAARRLAYDALYRTGTGDFRKESRLVTKGFEERAPGLAAAMKADLARLEALDAERRALDIAERSLALLTLARAVIDRVERAKTERGLLDFSDLVTHAAALLASEFAPWVRFKLDRGIDHVLVDEAQDTSPEQWRVVAAIAEEFFAGESARQAERTLFVVGDEKQSIFSFQGADPREFARMRALFADKAEGAGREFRELPLQLSFRSSTAVLSAVDAVFAREIARSGLTAANEAPLHQSARANLPGLVEIWPMVPRPERADVEGWRHPFDYVGRDDPRAVLADRVAREIRSWLASETVMDGKEARRMRAGDVMILVRRRGALFDALIRALKDYGVPVAGADRLKLIEHIAVMDLMALGDAVLLPEDDLVLASLMKSPLLGLREDDLFAIAHGRPGPLVAAFAARSPGTPRWEAAWRRFSDWRSRADLQRPYEFFAGVLGPDRGRTAFEGRLGREVNDALDEFLARALDYERAHTPSLQGFLAWMRETAVDVKREMEQGRDEVRVMTAHNSKGLEAKVVILPDTTARPSEGHIRRLLKVPAPGGAPLILWSPSKASDVGPLKEARTLDDRLQAEEHRRLLYVAMTRAEERLIICGHANGNAREPSPDSWYTLVREGLAERCTEELDAEGKLRALVWERRMANAPAQSVLMLGEGAAPVPAWARAPAESDRPPRAPLAPSRAGAERRLGQGAKAEAARSRGTLLHRLLQSLPDTPPERREAVARRLIEREAPDLVDVLLAELTAVLALPGFAPFLSADALAEVPIVGKIEIDGQILPVSGRIDRLAVTAEAVHLLDYKTGIAPAEGAIPGDVLAQLALYAALIERTHPGRRIEAAVLWTELPRLDPIAPDSLRAALTRAGRAFLAEP